MEKVGRDVSSVCQRREPGACRGRGLLPEGWRQGGQPSAGSGRPGGLFAAQNDLSHVYLPAPLALPSVLLGGGVAKQALLLAFCVLWTRKLRLGRSEVVSVAECGRWAALLQHTPPNPLFLQQELSTGCTTARSRSWALRPSLSWGSRGPRSMPPWCGAPRRPRSTSSEAGTTGASSPAPAVWTAPCRAGPPTGEGCPRRSTRPSRMLKVCRGRASAGPPPSPPLLLPRTVLTPCAPSLWHGDWGPCLGPSGVASEISQRLQLLSGWVVAQTRS